MLESQEKKERETGIEPVPQLQNTRVLSSSACSGTAENAPETPEKEFSKGGDASERRGWQPANTAYSVILPPSGSRPELAGAPTDPFPASDRSAAAGNQSSGEEDLGAAGDRAGRRLSPARNTSQIDWLAQAEATTIENALETILSALKRLSIEQRIERLNAIRYALHNISPFAAEPTDYVLWIPAEEVHANDYNPNTVAPPEMQLLMHSIAEDGYTQPIVAWINGNGYEVVDGFHRNRVGRENPAIRERLHGYLPLTVINSERIDRGDRIAATIRHNRARGKHQVEAMSDIVMELRRRNWTPDKIGKELGMDPDEVLRLTQITGMAELFSNEEFSASWSLDTADESLVKPELSEPEDEL